MMINPEVMDYESTKTEKYIKDIRQTSGAGRSLGSRRWRKYNNFIQKPTEEQRNRIVSNGVAVDKKDIPELISFSNESYISPFLQSVEKNMQKSRTNLLTKHYSSSAISDTQAVIDLTGDEFDISEHDLKLQEPKSQNQGYRKLSGAGRKRFMILLDNGALPETARRLAPIPGSAVKFLKDKRRWRKHDSSIPSKKGLVDEPVVLPLLNASYDPEVKTLRDYMKDVRNYPSTAEKSEIDAVGNQIRASEPKLLEPNAKTQIMKSNNRMRMPGTRRHSYRRKSVRRRRRNKRKCIQNQKSSKKRGKWGASNGVPVEKQAISDHSSPLNAQYFESAMNVGDARIYPSTAQYSDFFLPGKWAASNGVPVEEQGVSVHSSPLNAQYFAPAMNVDDARIYPTTAQYSEFALPVMQTGIDLDYDEFNTSEQEETPEDLSIFEFSSDELLLIQSTKKYEEECGTHFLSEQHYHADISDMPAFVDPASNGFNTSEPEKTFVEMPHSRPLSGKMTAYKTLRILPPNFPAEVWSTEEIYAVQKSILDKVFETRTEPVKPHFAGNAIESGWLSINCLDRETEAWVKKSVPALRPWDGAVLKVIDEADMRKTRVFVGYFPGSNSWDNSRILGQIEAQNLGIRTKEWRILERSQSKKAVELTISLDFLSAEAIDKMGNKLYYGFGKALLWSKKKKKAQKHERRQK